MCRSNSFGVQLAAVHFVRLFDGYQDITQRWVSDKFRLARIADGIAIHAGAAGRVDISHSRPCINEPGGDRLAGNGIAGSHELKCRGIKPIRQ